jgi:hypothetical protein
MICRWHSSVSILWVWVIGLWVFILTFGSFSAISWLPAMLLWSFPCCLHRISHCLDYLSNFIVWISTPIYVRNRE